MIKENLQEEAVMQYAENGNAEYLFQCSEEKPNIFLIGDSIRRGYCKTVKDSLADTAEVFYCDDNCRSTQYVIFSLRRWVNQFSAPEKVDIVQFNCGHWDLAHWNGYEEPLTSVTEYAKNIRMIIALLKKAFPAAKIIFATTTPMNPNGIFGVNPRTNEEIENYNRIAKEISAENGVDVFDLYEFTRNWGTEAYRDYCHFTESAFAELGEEVARKLKNVLVSKAD